MSHLRRHWLALMLGVATMAAFGLTAGVVAGEEPGSSVKEAEGSAAKEQEGSGSKEVEGSASKMKELLKHTYAEVNTEALEILVRLKVPMLIFDARTGKYDDGRRIPGARQLSPEATDRQVAGVVESTESLIVVYCINVECPLSRMLYLRLKKFGYKNVIEYPYGIEGWVKAGNKYEMAEGSEVEEEGSGPKGKGSAEK